MDDRSIQLLRLEIAEVRLHSNRIGEEIRASGRGAHWVSCWGDQFHQRRRRAMQLTEFIDDKTIRDELQYQIRSIP